MLQEDFLPQKWFNSIFSELNNFELVQYPTEKDWFFSEIATLKKREWLYSEKDHSWEYKWQTDWDIMWKLVVWWTMFIRDDQCSVYRFDLVDWNYVLTKVYNNYIIWYDDDQNPIYESSLFTEDMYGRHVKQKAICISYLNKLNKTFTADKDNSSNFDWTNTTIAANEAWTFTDWSWGPTEENMLSYYIYFPSTSSSQVRGQIRQITEIPAWENGKKAYLSQQFYWEPTDWNVNEPCEIYEWVEDVVVFNNIRNAEWQVLTIWITNGETHFRNLGWIDVELFEWRYWYINSYGTSVGWSLASWEYEILDPTTVRGSSIDSRWQKMNSLVLIKNYLLINMENSMSVIWKMATWDNDVDPIYNLNSIINGESAITPEAIFFKSWLYFVSWDRLFEWWDVQAVSSNMIYWETTNQWETIQTWLNKISYWNFVRCYWLWRNKIIQHVIWWRTQFLVYDDLYEWWLPWEYRFAIYDQFDKFYDDWVIWVWNKVCLKRWDNDLWENISCKVYIVWSKNYINSLFSLKKIKLSLWFYNNVQNFKVKVDLWYAIFEWHIEKSAEWVLYIEWQNMAWQNKDWLWPKPVWVVTLWWWNEPWWLQDYIAKIWLIWIPIWKKCSYYKITFENLENYNLNITWISVLTEWWNTYITPVVNVF